MSRRAWLFGWISVGAVVVAMLGFAVHGVWVGSERSVNMAILLLFVSVPAACFMTAWSENPPAPNLPRADRKRLRDERRRIELDRRITQLEREAGLR